MSGRYACEISADAPSFSTAYSTGDMHVVVLPSTLPEVGGIKRRYKVGDSLKATCISRQSRPAANLTWSVNGHSVSSDYVRQYKVIRDGESDLETSLSTMLMELQREHFKSSGRLKVRCTASIYNIYWRTTEHSAEEERPKAAVASQDRRLNENQLRNRKPTEYLFEATPSSSSSQSVAHQRTHNSQCKLIVLSLCILLFCAIV